MTVAADAPVITHQLCEAFAMAAEALARRRAGEIAERDLEAFDALGWLDWHGGSLRVTPLGHMALIRIRARIEAVA